MTNKKRLEIINNNLDVIKELAQNLRKPAISTFSDIAAQKIVLEYLQQMSSSANSAFVALSALEVDKINQQEISAVEGNAEIVYAEFEAAQPAVKKFSKGKSSEIETQYNEVADKLAELEIGLNNFTDKKNNKAVVSDVKNTRLKRNVVTGVAFTAALAGIGMLLVNNSKDSGGNLNYKLKIEALENELADYKNYMTTLSQEITKLLNEKEALENEKADLENKLKNANNSAEIERLTNDLNKVTDELKKVKEDYAKYKEAQADINKSYETLKQQNEELLKQNKEFKETIKDLEGQIKEKDEEIKGLNSSIESLKGEISAKEAEIGNLNSQIEAYKKALENAGSGSTGGNSDEALRKQIAELESKLNAANSELAILKSTNESLQNSLTSVTAERDDYYAKYFVASSELQKANEEKEALKSENQGLKDENQGLKDNNQALNAEIERLNKVIESYKNNGGSLDYSARFYVVTFLTNKGNDCTNMSDEEMVKLLIQYAGGDLGGIEKREDDLSPKVEEDEESKPSPGYGIDDGPINEPNL